MPDPTVCLEYELPEALYQRLQAVLEAHTTLSADEVLTQALVQYLAALPA